MFSQHLPLFLMLLDQKILCFFLMFWLIFTWLQHCPWERKGTAISKPLSTLFFPAQPPSTNDLVLKSWLIKVGRQGIWHLEPALQWDSAGRALRNRDLNSFNTAVWEKTATMHATNSPKIKPRSMVTQRQTSCPVNSTLVFLSSSDNKIDFSKICCAMLGAAAWGCERCNHLS